jgi:hypothetical protein
MPLQIRSLYALGLATLIAACAMDTAPSGAFATPEGNGPVVVFDLQHRPLPEIPIPNDVATFADPTSRTGLRVNVSTIADTRLEITARKGFADLEGWGTMQPITVSFENADATRSAPALDLDVIKGRMQDPTYDFKDDPVYVINLRTGVPAILDMGQGNFPSTIVDDTSYWPNDPHRSGQNLLFETNDEGAAGLPYSPRLDRDFDGFLDHPNTLPRGRDQRPGVDDLLTWYERQTDTLRLRPLVPLEEKTEYAVVLTDRLKSVSGNPVRSPFAAIHHPTQRAAADRVAQVLGNGDLERYYGSIAGTGLLHVAFVWSFTTQPVTEDLVLLRDGLYGRGPFARLADQFPPVLRAQRAAGPTRNLADAEPGWEKTSKCAARASAPFIVKVDQTIDVVGQLLEQAIGVKGVEKDRLVQSLGNVDYFVVGTYRLPYFLGDPKNEDPDGRFEMNFRTGEARMSEDVGHYWISVPKASNKAQAPFSTVLWAHGTTLHADEILVRAGYFAQQGLAMMGIDMPGHGLYLNRGLEQFAQVALTGTCLTPWLDAITTGRHHDLNNDGTPDSGGYLWTAHLFHSRDNIRQAVVDMTQSTRILRAFGTSRVQDYNGDGALDLLGDFNADGVPDLGGPGTKIYTSGNSFGGILSMVHGAIDPEVTAAAAISGGGGLTDIAVRSDLTPAPVILQLLSPMLLGQPVRELGSAPTKCTKEQISLRLLTVDVTNARYMEVACLRPEELGPNKTVVFRNIRSRKVSCARTDEFGRFRVAVGADKGDRLDIQVYDGEDAVSSFDGCALTDTAVPGRRVTTFEQPAVSFGPTVDDSNTCEAAMERAGIEPDARAGCAQFQDRFYPVGTQLVAPQEGLGLSRQSPELRRLLDLTQGGIESSDPINYARAYVLSPLTHPNGARLPPRGVAVFNTTGDPLVPTGTGISFARAAGAVPFLPPEALDRYPEYADYVTPQALYDQLGKKTPNQVLIDNHVVEGLARMERTRAGSACAANYAPSATCSSRPDTVERCKKALYDADWLAEGKDLWDAPHPQRPLRLARAAGTITNASDLDAVWAPRLRAGLGGTDDNAYVPTSQPLVSLVNAYNDPLGQHVWVNGNPCKAFDDAVYYNHLLIRYLASRGTDMYFASHPSSHRCLERETCPFFR